MLQDNKQHALLGLEGLVLHTWEISVQDWAPQALGVLIWLSPLRDVLLGSLRHVLVSRETPTFPPIKTQSRDLGCTAVSGESQTGAPRSCLAPSCTRIRRVHRIWPLKSQPLWESADSFGLPARSCHKVNRHLPLNSSTTKYHLHHSHNICHNKGYECVSALLSSNHKNFLWQQKGNTGRCLFPPSDVQYWILLHMSNLSYVI